MSDIPLKRCPYCPDPEENKWHPATPEYFHRNKSRKDGLCAICKVCKNQWDKINYRRPGVREKELSRNVVYRSCPGNQEKAHAYQRIWRQQNLLRDKERKKEWAKAHPERIQAASKRYSQAHPDRYRNHYKDHYKEKRQKWYRSHSEIISTYRRNRRARKKAVAGKHTIAQVVEQLKRQKYRCYYAACGHVKFERKKKNGEWVYDYHIDHTYPLSRVVGTDIPANDMSYLVLACPTCNLSKHNKYPWEWPEGGRLL